MNLPMLAVPSTGASGRRPQRLEDLIARHWLLDLKLDGVRAFARFGRLINREGTDITRRYPEIDLPGEFWLDGEIVAEDGRFETTLLRDQQSNVKRIADLAIAHPCRFVAFDMIATQGVNYADERLPYTMRRRNLERVTTYIEVTPTGVDMAFFDQVKDLGMEGVIAKRPESVYRFGARSKDWVKFKHLHRVTAVAVGYEPGQGQRAHFGALKLALIDGDVAVPLGKVGSGFTEKDTRALKARLDAGELFVVEVECVNRTKGNVLRFPVFKGVRTDVDITACTTAQLDTLPTC